MAAFLLHHRLERLDQRRRKEARALGQREQAKGEEAVDALAEAGDHERPFGVARAQIIGFHGEADAVGLDHIGKDLLVPPLLEAVELDRLAQQRVRHRLGVAQHPQTGFPFGLHRDIPDRQADQTIARLGVERGPVDDRGTIGIVGVEQHPAKRPLVRFAAGNDRAGFGRSPNPGGAIGRLNPRVSHHRRQLFSPFLPDMPFPPLTHKRTLGKPAPFHPRNRSGR